MIVHYKIFYLVLYNDTFSTETELIIVTIKIQIKTIT